MFTSKKSFAITITTFFFLGVAMFLYSMYFQDASAEQRVYSGKENHTIALGEAEGLTSRVQVEMNSADIIAYYFGRSAFQKTLAQDGCVGIRIYYAKHTDGSPALVLVGVDHKGNDMNKGVVSQMGFPCPPMCSDESSLMHPRAISLNR